MLPHGQDFFSLGELLLLAILRRLAIVDGVYFLIVLATTLSPPEPIPTPHLGDAVCHAHRGGRQRRRRSAGDGSANDRATLERDDDRHTDAASQQRQPLCFPRSLAAPRLRPRRSRRAVSARCGRSAAHRAARRRRSPHDRAALHAARGRTPGRILRRPVGWLSTSPALPDRRRLVLVRAAFASSDRFRLGRSAYILFLLPLTARRRTAATRLAAEARPREWPHPWRAPRRREPCGVPASRRQGAAACAAPRSAPGAVCRRTGRRPRAPPRVHRRERPSAHRAARD